MRTVCAGYAASRLKRLTEKKLEDLGVSMGDAMMILIVLQADEEPLGPTEAAG